MWPCVPRSNPAGEDSAMPLLSHADVLTARDRLAALGTAGPVRTPLLSVSPDESHHAMLIKPEGLQPTGAFKIRGALNATASIAEADRARGIVAYSSGNHARAVAYAGKVFDVPTTVVVPHTAPEAKIAATRALGAEIVPVEVAERETRAHKIAEERGATLIPPFDDPAVIAGQGTCGLEIAEDLPDDFTKATVLVPISGGGLASGVGLGLLPVRDRVRLIGVEPELAADARESLIRDERTNWSVQARTRTRADGLTAQPSELTFAHLRELVDDVLTVSESEIDEAVAHLAESSRLVAERSGAVTVAAARHRENTLPSTPLVAVVSGGNIDPVELARVLGGTSERDSVSSRAD